MLISYVGQRCFIELPLVLRVCLMVQVKYITTGTYCIIVVPIPFIVTWVL